jgi:hypothetical protein
VAPLVLLEVMRTSIVGVFHLFRRVASLSSIGHCALIDFVLMSGKHGVGALRRRSVFYPIVTPVTVGYSHQTELQRLLLCCCAATLIVLSGFAWRRWKVGPWFWEPRVNVSAMVAIFVSFSVANGRDSIARYLPWRGQAERGQQSSPGLLVEPWASLGHGRYPHYSRSRRF